MKLNYDLVYDILKFSEEVIPYATSEQVHEMNRVIIHVKKMPKDDPSDIYLLSNLERLKKYSWKEIQYHFMVIDRGGFFLTIYHQHDFFDSITIHSLSMKGHEFIAVYEGRDVPRQYFLK